MNYETRTVHGDLLSLPNTDAVENAESSTEPIPRVGGLLVHDVDDRLGGLRCCERKAAPSGRDCGLRGAPMHPADGHSRARRISAPLTGALGLGVTTSVRRKRPA